LLQAFEIVADRSDKIPFAPTLQLNARIREQAMARGLLVYAMGGTIDGRRGDHILLAPPFTVQDKDLDLIIDRLADAIDAVLASLPTA
jgi:adenosylmethionine-8-amino-7-oxononanoate aminotransferase